MSLLKFCVVLPLVVLTMKRLETTTKNSTVPCWSVQRHTQFQCSVQEHCFMTNPHQEEHVPTANCPQRIWLYVGQCLLSWYTQLRSWRNNFSWLSLVITFLNGGAIVREKQQIIASMSNFLNLKERFLSCWLLFVGIELSCVSEHRVHYHFSSPIFLMSTEHTLLSPHIHFLYKHVILSDWN